MDEKQCVQVKLHIEEFLEEGILFVTKDAEAARRLAACGKAVLGVLTEDNREDSFLGVKFLTEAFDEKDIGYLERVYRRCAGLPWKILETKRLLVRESTVEDVDAFDEIYREKTVGRFMHDLAAERQDRVRYMTQYRENIYEFYEFGIWTVILKETGEVIGRAGISMRDGFEVPELGFVIGKPWQNKGYAKEVSEAILAYGRKEFGFTEYLAFTESENQKAMRLLSRLGFKKQEAYLDKGISYIRYEKKL